MTTQQLIDVEDFTRFKKTLTGQLSVGDLSRLQDLIVAGQEQLHYELQGSMNADHEARITCIIRGSVLLECQRCLSVFGYPLEIRSTLIFVANEADLPEIEDEDETVDYLVAQSNLDVLALVEDEVILALPLVPRHASNQCKNLQKQHSGAEKLSPFAALKKLKPN